METSKKIRKQYGALRRDGVIVKKSLSDIKHQFSTINMSYVFGEIYEREILGNDKFTEWVLSDKSF